jgi:2-aminoadipate transaminase
MPHPQNPLAKRMQNLKPSFIRQILKVTQDPNIISFAGGLPNPAFFPTKALETATQKVLSQTGSSVLQYTVTAGFPPLREWIVSRYYRQIPNITPDDIIITTGSQQGIDLIGKLLLDPDDAVVVEDPSYLGALQSLNVYQPRFIPIPLQATGIDVTQLSLVLETTQPKCLYAVPNFHNPTGISYSPQLRNQVATLIEQQRLLLIEDDPYHEIYFSTKPQAPIKLQAPEHTFHLGSFSKMVAPGLRLGWICPPKAYRDQLIMLKEAADLHSSHLSQQIIYEFIRQEDVLSAHLNQVREGYRKHRDLMLATINQTFPDNCTGTQPEGGMFTWVTLPSHLSASSLFDTAIKHQVAFVPGKYFFAQQQNDSCFRLNYSNASEANIVRGITILGQLIHQARV